jgi:pimeloyl-ACP methyl ester carboxylesterase
LNKEASEIAGEFKQGGMSVPLILKRTAKPTALNRPQEPKKPYPYDEEEVGYENKRDGVKLAGTLTLPHGEGPFPAALLITGSGPQDRNESLAGTGLTGEEILYLQGALIMKAGGASAEQLAKQRATQEIMFKILKEEKDSATAKKRLHEELSKSLTEDERKKSEQTIAVQIKQANTPWFRYFLTLDPRPALRKVKCPVLALNGENDLQVPVSENLREIEATLKAGGNKDVTTVRLPKLNHLFQTSETGSPNEYSKIEETIAPVALKTIGDWILERTTTQR